MPPSTTISVGHLLITSSKACINLTQSGDNAYILQKHTSGSIMEGLINAKITQKMLCYLYLLKAYLYNGYMSKFAKLTPYGMESM